MSGGLGSGTPRWAVLLIGGTSGVGKTIAAEQIGRRLGMAWLQMDDFRLALQHSQATLPAAEATAALRLFWDTPDVWQRPAEQLRDGLIAVGAALIPAIEIVIANHVDTRAPAIIEGDGIVPALFARPLVRDRVTAGQVRGVFLVEPDEAVLEANMRARARGIAGRPAAELRSEAQVKRLFGEWLAGEAPRYGVPVLAPRPWNTLVERILAVVAPELPAAPA